MIGPMIGKVIGKVIGPRKADPARAITAQIIAALLPATSVLVNAKSVDWASATFTGARHELTILVSGEGADIAAQNVAQRVSEIDFSIGGHIVADISAVCGQRTAEGLHLLVEALSVEAV